MKHSIALLAMLVYSMHILMWAASPPCTLAPESQEDFDTDWTYVDANGDGEPYRFAYSADYGAYYTQNKSMAADDWIISPAVTLGAGKSYTVTATVQNLSTFSSDKQAFTVFCGLSRDPESMTSQILRETALTKTAWPVERSGNLNIDSDGDYYIGLHLTSSSYMGDFALVSFKVEEIVPLPGAVTGLEVKAGGSGELRAELGWTWPSLNSLGGTLSGLEGARIYRSSSASQVVREENLAGVFSGDAVPGETAVWTDSGVPSAGVWHYAVVPFNAEGESPSAAPVAASPWIGPDSGVGSLSDLTATAVEGDERAVRLTWTAPAGSHGGYVDLSALRYRLCRSDNGGAAEVIAEDCDGTEYIDTSIPGLGSYVYHVYTVYNGSTSFTASKSNAVVTGGSLGLPYSNDFATASSVALFSFFHTSGTRDWVYSSSKKALDFWGNNTPGASFAVLPVFSLESGKSYCIDFSTWISTARSPKNLSVRIGKTPDEAGLGEILWEETVTSTYSTGVSVPFSVDESGRYYMAFVVTDSSDSNDIFVNALSVTEVATAPLPVSDARAEAAPEGELKAVLFWRNPSETTAGTPIATVDRVEIMRGGILLDTLASAEGGAECSYEDSSVAEPGVYTYAITPYIGDVAGETVELVSGWIGHDVPAAPADITAVENADGTHTVTFAHVTAGVHDGYIDTESLRYTVTRNGEVLATDVVSSPYTDTDTTLPLAMYTYAVFAVSGNMAGEPAEAAPVRGGEALSLPYDPDFGSAADFELWTFVNPEGKSSNWKYNSSKQTLEASFTPDNAWAFTPPVRIEEGKCCLTFRAACYSSRYPEDMEIWLTREADAENPEKVLQIGEFHIDKPNPLDDTEVDFDVAQTGVYHIGYLLPKYNWTLSLTKAGLEQTYVVETGVLSAGTEGGLRYEAATCEIVVPESGVTRVFTLQGAEAIISDASRISVSALPCGVYVAVSVARDGKCSRLRFVR